MSAPWRLSNLKEELRSLRSQRDDSPEDRRARVPQSETRASIHRDPFGGMHRSGTADSTTTLDDSTDASTAAPTPLSTCKGTASDFHVKPSDAVVHGNRFHCISDEACESQKQPTIKRLARSPTAAGAAEISAEKHGRDASGLFGASSTAHTVAVMQKFSHLLVCDFECTCDGGEPAYPHEIIEFPVVAVDTGTCQVVAVFHTYVRPVLNPVLTPFCTKLTGIEQAQVDGAPTIRGALDMFHEWLRSTLIPLVVRSQRRSSPPPRARTGQPAGVASSEPEAVLSNEGEFDDAQSVQQLYASTLSHSSIASLPFIFVTDGPSDMRHFMHNCHVRRDGVEFSPLFYRWLNIRRAFADHFHTRPENLTKMLRRCGLVFHGQHHSGIDDAKNIARVAVSLIRRGHRLQHVSSIPYAPSGSPEVEAERAADDLLKELLYDDDVGPQRSKPVKEKARRK